MRDLLPHIQSWLAEGERIAAATVVRVIGSAPRPVGARLVVSSSGRMAGSVSGGCVETAVVTELMMVLSGGAPRLLHFGITEDMIWDVGLACGGEIDVFVQSLDPCIPAVLADQLRQREPVALVTPTSGEAVGSWAVVTAEGMATGQAEPALVAAAQARLSSRAQPRLVPIGHGGAEAFVEPFFPAPVLLLIGGVHIAISLSRFGKALGFRVVVVDPRSHFANRERFPEADEVWAEWPDAALAHIPVDNSTYLVLLTHDPKIDEPALAAAVKTGAAYIGAIGSRKTHAGRAERMARWGVTAEQLERVYAPIGLDLGGRTPEEAALSILAEVVAVKNGRRGGFLREARGPIASVPPS